MPAENEKTADFGVLLRQHRRRAGLTQETLAERAGISVQAIAALERGVNRSPRRDTLQLLSEALDLSSEERAELEAARTASAARAAPHFDATHIYAVMAADVREAELTYRYGDEAGARLVTRFVQVAREVAAAGGGTVIETRGGRVLAAFRSVRQALQGAVEVQEQLANAAGDFPSEALRPRVGIDAGELVALDGGYGGSTVNLALGLCDLAEPGEILASAAVRQLVHQIEGMVYLDRGETEVGGAPEPVLILQLAAAGTEAAELKRFSPRPGPPSNLPVEPNRFIGREEEICHIVDLLGQREVRLITLLGPGGTGKTRLALHVAWRSQSLFPDGVFFVPLAAVSESSHVPVALAEALGMGENGSTPLIESLHAFLLERRLLLVVDNLEHLLDASLLLASLLETCPNLTILATSRASLRLQAEYAVHVPPLAFPDPEAVSELKDLENCEAIALFVERARAASGTFQLTQHNASTVARICAQVEGIPLAIELAAARTRLFPPEALLARLSSRLSFLTGGARDAPTRQQTLRSTIDWSYRLLDEQERRLFARMGVFAGGAPWEVLEPVCDSDGALGADLVEALEGLVSHSLISCREGQSGPRYVMLETIREFALEQLEASGEAGELRRIHAEAMAQLAERAESELTGANQVECLKRLDELHDNLRGALLWTLETPSIQTGLRIAGSLWRFWWMRGQLSEGRKWLDGLLALTSRDDDTVDPAVRARALNGVGVLSHLQDDYRRATALLQESLELRRQIGDREGEAACLGNLGTVALMLGQYEQAANLYEQSLLIHRQLQNRQQVATALNNLGVVRQYQLNYASAGELFRESLEIRRELADMRGVASSLSNLGAIALYGGNFAEARALHTESLSLRRELGDSQGMAITLAQLGRLARLESTPSGAGAAFGESLTLYQRIGDKLGIVECLEGIGGVMAMTGHMKEAARLFGAATSLRNAIATPMLESDRASYEADLALVRAGLDDDELHAAWLSGEVAVLHQTIDNAVTLAHQALQALDAPVDLDSAGALPG